MDRVAWLDSHICPSMSSQAFALKHWVEVIYKHLMDIQKPDIKSRQRLLDSTSSLTWKRKLNPCSWWVHKLVMQCMGVVHAQFTQILDWFLGFTCSKMVDMIPKMFLTPFTFWTKFLAYKRGQTVLRVVWQQRVARESS